MSFSALPSVATHRKDGIDGKSYVDGNTNPHGIPAPISVSYHLGEERGDEAREQCSRVHQPQEVTRRVVEELLPCVDGLKSVEKASVIYEWIQVNKSVRGRDVGI